MVYVSADKAKAEGLNLIAYDREVTNLADRTKVENFFQTRAPWINIEAPPVPEK
jgi:hypothetical protein